MTLKLTIPDSFSENFIPEMMGKMRSLLDQIEEAVWEDDAVVANELVDKCKSIIDAVEEYYGGF
ncbi:hypothetical protein CPT_LL12_103 [Escherichia phage LL12]|uniref:Uncharacterized protein n=1 Tax=Escherichia phage LL12 TaxID=2233993 RepID=A0A2Z5HRJ4_9CAUD|nr:hypothetical protein CPT_LL12_103 [Escherichia phage LL12]